MEIAKNIWTKFFDVRNIHTQIPEFKPSDMAPRAMNGVAVRIETSRRREALSWRPTPAPPPWESLGSIAARVVSMICPDDAA